jgi:hypothetical protein
MSEEWSEWFLHDGRGCPCVGGFVHTISERETGRFFERRLIAAQNGGKSWDWSNYPKYTRVIRYRIRKPKGLTILEGLLENLPERETA